jgi:hypothetical protein
LYHAGFNPHQLLRLWASAGCADLVLQALVLVLAVMAVVAVLKNMYALPKMPVYLVDFSVHKGLDEWRFSKDMFVPLSSETGVSDDPPEIVKLATSTGCTAATALAVSKAVACADRHSQSSLQQPW